MSIITVTYNAGEILERTIKSVLNQSYSNLEYIIIDGKSTDNTLDIIHTYTNHISKWISEPDNGLYDAMNKGIKLASGNYLWFLNAGDEVFAPDTITKMLSMGEADIYYSDTLVVNMQGSEIGLLSKLTHNNAPDKLNWRKMKQGMVVCHQSFVVNRQIVVPYSVEYKLSADIDWVIRSLKAAKSVVRCEFLLSKFLTAGLSKQYLGSSMKERYQILKTHFGFFPNLWNHLFLAIRFLTTSRKNKLQ
ncbi:MAG: glycosyltransferase [Bacteroidetes bacterium]|nr:glycosyltransferase [Bacteroidota bacterium]